MNAPTRLAALSVAACLDTYWKVMDSHAEVSYCHMSGCGLIVTMHFSQGANYRNSSF